MTTTTGSAAELDAITRDLDTTTAAWAAVGHPFDGPEHEAREAVFARLRAWNSARETWTAPTMAKGAAS